MKKTLLTLALVAATAIATYAQGTVQFNNNSLTRVTWVDATGANRGNVAVGTAVFFGLFVNGSLTPVSTPGTTDRLGTISQTTPGVFAAPSGGLYPIPGHLPNETVQLQVRGWSSSFGSDWQAASRTPGALFGATDVRPVVLGQETAAAAVIWQLATQTAPDKFRPLVLFEVVPEPSTIALAVLGLGSLLLFRRRK
jgi:hypothetical protein